jgi:hypothetical protein
MYTNIYIYIGNLTPFAKQAIKEMYTNIHILYMYICIYAYTYIYTYLHIYT